MPHVTATFEIRNDRIDRHDDDRKDNRVLVEEQDRRTITLQRDLENVEDAVWALEAKDSEVVYDLWGEVKDEPEFEAYKTYPYAPDAEVSVKLDYKAHMHDVIHHVAARDRVTPLSVYMQPPGFFGRVHDTETTDGWRGAYRHRGQLLSEYLAYEGMDSSDWTHGHSPSRKGRRLRRVREAVQLADRAD